MILVLISDFKQDEIYLNEEIEYYHGFDKIIYFSVKGHDYSNSPLETRNGVVSGERDIFYTGIKDRMYRLMQGFFTKDGIKEAVRIIRGHKLSRFTIQSFLLFTAKSKLVYSHIKQSLEKLGIQEDDNIVFYSYRFGVATFASIELKKFYKNSIVVSRGHGQDIFEFRNPYEYLPYRIPMLDRVDSLVFISDDGIEYMRNKYPTYASKFVVSKLGTADIDINHNLGRRPFVIWTCSRIVPIKRLHLLAEALSQITFDVKWVHFGEGNDPAYVALVEDLTKKCPPNVEVDFRGFIDNQELRQIYVNEPSTIFLNVSSSEGLPVSIMEACSVGLPIVATNVGGTKEIVKNGINGFLLKSDFKMDELVEVLTRVYEMSDEAYLEMTKSSRKIWENSFSSCNNYGQFAGYLTELADERNICQTM